MKNTYIESMINPSFYDPLKEKSKPTKETYSEICKLFCGNSISIDSLQYEEPETIKYSKGARVYKVHADGKIFKIRLAHDENDAARIINSINFADNIGVPVPIPARQQGKFLIMPYSKSIANLKLNLEDISQIALFQSRMNSVNFKEMNNLIGEKINNLVKISLNYIESQVDSNSLYILRRKLERFPDIVATFDHQDYGIHNIIKTNTGKLMIVDEEAFGVLPLGYGIVRPIFDRAGYRLADDIKIKDYLKNHSVESRDYILDNLSFLRALFIARNSCRRIIAGNLQSAKNLLSEAKQL